MSGVKSRPNQWIDLPFGLQCSIDDIQHGMLSVPFWPWKSTFYIHATPFAVPPYPNFLVLMLTMLVTKTSMARTYLWSSLWTLANQLLFIHKQNKFPPP